MRRNGSGRMAHQIPGVLRDGNVLFIGFRPDGGIFEKKSHRSVCLLKLGKLTKE